MKRYPPVMMATVVTPWDENFELDEAKFRQEIRAVFDGLTEHVYTFGTAGEGYAVSDAQFKQIVRIFHEESNAPGARPAVGVISLSLTTIIERLEYCRDLGFRSFQISLPSWGALNDVELDCFFQETCGRFPDCTFLHYNLSRSQRLLGGAEYGRLAAAHPNLASVKTGVPDDAWLEDALARAPEVQFFLGEAAYASTRDRHECGYLVSMGHLNFARAKLFFESRGDELQRYAAELAEVLDLLLACVGDSAHIDGAYDKLYAKTRNPEFPLRLLPPYASSTDATFEALMAELSGPWRPGG